MKGHKKDLTCMKNRAIMQQATSNKQQATSHNNVLVSIIIPAYNTEKYIHRAIESSIRQTHNNIEIIIIDDGSEDNTLKTAQSYSEKDSRIKVFTQNNSGVSGARNRGIREAKGKYIIFLDSDDWLEDNAAEFLLDAQMKYPDKLICTENYNAYFKEDGKLYRSRNKQKKESQVLTRDQAIINSDNMHLQSSCYKIFNAKIIRENNIHFDENLCNHEDGLFVFEYVNRTNGIYYIDESLFVILERPGSAIRSGYSYKMAASLVESKRKMMNYPGNSPEIKKFSSARYARAMLRYIDILVLNADRLEEIPDLRKNIFRYRKELLTSKGISRKVKIAFFYKLLLPEFIIKQIAKFYDFLERKRVERIRSNNTYEEIVNLP